MIDDEDDTVIGGSLLGPSLSPPASYDILGAALQQSPAFQALLAKRAAMNAPVVRPMTIAQMPKEVETGLTEDKVDELLTNEPAFSTYAERQPAPNYTRKQPLQKARDWDIPIGPVYAPAGTQTTISVQPACLFRGEKIIATDTAPTPGTGTVVTGLFVGAKSQWPASHMGIPTAAFSHNSLGSGMRMDTCQPALAIAMTISFIIACTFSAYIFGKAVL